VSRLLRAAIFGIAISATPACALFAANPPTATQVTVSVDQQAYLLIGSYALALEEATRLARDPATPKAVKVALGSRSRSDAER
jgi:hypothetical protein